MKKMLSISVAILFMMSSCGDSKPYQEVESQKKMKIDSATENRYAYIKEIIESGERLFIKVDYVDFLIGEEALEAEWRDQAYFIDGGDTISNITDGFYISNINPKTRVFMIGKNAKVENIIDSDGYKKMKTPKHLNTKQLREYIEMNTLLFLHVKDGTVERIDERFIP